MKIRGAWSADEVQAYLERAIIPLRLATSNGRGPLVLSLWFIPLERRLWCATNCDARLIEYVKLESRCGFEVASDQPPYKGIRGQGIASLHPSEGEPILRRLLERYRIAPESKFAQKLLARADQEVAIAIEPTSLASWDFSNRMRDAVAP